MAAVVATEVIAAMVAVMAAATIMTRKVHAATAVAADEPAVEIYEARPRRGRVR